MQSPLLPRRSTGCSGLRFCGAQRSQPGRSPPPVQTIAGQSPKPRSTSAGIEWERGREPKGPSFPRPLCCPRGRQEVGGMGVEMTRASSCSSHNPPKRHQPSGLRGRGSRALRGLIRVLPQDAGRRSWGRRGSGRTRGWRAPGVPLGPRGWDASRTADTHCASSHTPAPALTNLSKLRDCTPRIPAYARPTGPIPTIPAFPCWVQRPSWGPIRSHTKKGSLIKTPSRVLFPFIPHPRLSPPPALGI